MLGKDKTLGDTSRQRLIGGFLLSAGLLAASIGQHCLSGRCDDLADDLGAARRLSEQLRRPDVQADEPTLSVVPEHGS
jgi:hypothetical protein